MMNIRVVVEVQPKIIGPEPVTRVFAGGPAMLSCNAEGNPPPTVAWYSRLSQSVLLGTGEKYRIFENGTLLIRRVEESDGGKLREREKE